MLALAMNSLDSCQVDSQINFFLNKYYLICFTYHFILKLSIKTQCSSLYVRNQVLNSEVRLEALTIYLHFEVQLEALTSSIL